MAVLSSETFTFRWAAKAHGCVSGLAGLCAAAKKAGVPWWRRRTPCCLRVITSQGSESWRETLADFAFGSASGPKGAAQGQAMTTGGLQSLKWLSFLRRTAFTHFLFCITRASSVKEENIALCGTRGWLASGRMPSGKGVCKGGGPPSCFACPCAGAYPLAERVAVPHYPPIYAGGAAQEMLDAMAQYGVKRCFTAICTLQPSAGPCRGNVEGGIPPDQRRCDAICPYEI